jgi:hypothetical protein
MPNLLDELPYPWHKKEAQQLHITLCQISPAVNNTVLAAEKSNIDTSQIFTNQAVYMVWVEILNFAAAHGQLRILIKDMYDRLPPTSPARPFLEELLANKTAVPDAEPRGMNGAPVFIKGTDDIFDNEALLYRDDLTLQTGRVLSLIATLQKMMALSPAICRLTVNINGSEQYGTAFRIGPDLLLTNWHVLHRIHDGLPASAVTAEFGYEEDSTGGALAAIPVKCDVATIVTDKTNDWAVIKTSGAMDNAWPVIKLSEAVAPQLNAAAYIIQHPRGYRKRIGFIRNQVSDFDNRVVHYLTDTQEGSSGSPVFDQEGKLFALHHAGGRPQEVLGRPPMTKNEGISILRVVLDLQNKGVVFS